MSEFVGREAEIDLLARRVASGAGSPLLLTGPPRIGRTALLREFRKRRGPRAESGGVLLARVACHPAALSPLHLATAVAGELAMRVAVADGLELDRDRVFDPARFAGAVEGFPVRAIADFGRAIGSFSRGTRKGPGPVLRATANLAELVGEERDCWVTLLLDDLASLCVPRVQAFVDALAALTAGGRRTILVATARTGSGAGLLAGPASPFAGQFDVHTLGPLDEASGDALVLRMGSRVGAYPSQAVLARVQQLAAGHPFYIRAICDSVLAHFDRETRLGPEAIDAAFAREMLHPQGSIALHCAAQARAAIDGAGGGSTVTLALAALAESDRPNPGNVAQRLRGATRPVRPAAQALMASDLFTDDGAGSRFIDPVVRFWCARAMTRDRLGDVDRAPVAASLAREFADRFRAVRGPSQAPNFRALAALCAGRNLPGDFFSTSGTVEVPKFQRIQGYAFAERDMKLYALEIDPADDVAPRSNGVPGRWAALFVWRDIELDVPQVEILQRWLRGRTDRVWVIARRGLTPEAADRAESEGLFVSDESDLESLARHLGAGSLSAGRTGKTARMESPPE